MTHVARYRAELQPDVRMPNQDATAIVVVVARDGTDLGLFRAVVSRIEEQGFDRQHRSFTVRQFRRLVAEALVDRLKAMAADGTLRTEWRQDIEDVAVDTASIVRRAGQLTRPPLDYRPGDAIEFDV